MTLPARASLYFIFRAAPRGMLLLDRDSIADALGGFHATLLFA